jgi:3D (Asp-Asp-Asp) domain-containing protein
MSWVIVAVFFLIIGIIIGGCMTTSKAVDEIPETNEASETSEITLETLGPETTESETTSEPIPEYIYTSLGEYRLTAYCACEKCCGYWATVRPKDEDGNPIVYTANQSIAKQGVTVAADTSVLPFGTVLLIDGHEYIVQDRGGSIKENRIDIYFESHEEALQFGVQYKEIFIKEKNQ